MSQAAQTPATMEELLQRAFKNNLTLDQVATLKMLKQDILEVAFVNPIQDPVQFAIERAHMQGQVSIIDFILSQE
jgi:hypothetical protein